MAATSSLNMFRWSSCFQALIVFSLLHVLAAKHHVREVKLHSAASWDPSLQWKYLSKFSYGMGIGRSRIRVRNKGIVPDYGSDHIPYSVKVEIYMDEDWPGVEANPVICERQNSARLQHEVHFSSGGLWSDWSTNMYSQSIRPHMWFFAISDCDNMLGNHSHQLEVEMVMIQENDSEVSYENRWALTTNVIALVVFGLFSVNLFRKSGSFRQINGALHPVITTLGVAIVLQLTGHLFHTRHLWAYSGDGVGLVWSETVSEIFFMLSQVLIAALLIIIAGGYTLTRSKVGDMELIIISSWLVAFVHVLAVIAGKYRDDDAWRFHEHEGAHGWLLFALRLALWAWFVFAARSTAADAGGALKNFLQGFSLVGSAYFLSYPIMFIVVRIFAAYLQTAILTAGITSMQVASVAWLGSLFLSRGAYFQVSSLNSSQLPQRSTSADKLLPSSWRSRIQGFLGMSKKSF